MIPVTFLGGRPASKKGLLLKERIFSLEEEIIDINEKGFFFCSGKQQEVDNISKSGKKTCL